MHIDLEPELTMPVFEGIGSPQDVAAAASAMFASAQYLHAFGGGTDDPSEPDRITARAVMSEAVPPQAIQNTGAAVHLKRLLDDYDQQVVQSYAQIRQYVVNSLLEESGPGMKGRIRALELLGKVAGVDLFIERSEVTVRHKSTDDLEALVREKLAKLSASEQGADVQDVEFNVAGAPMLAEPVPALKENPFDKAEQAFNAIVGGN